MEEKINQRIAWIEQRVELSELAKEYIAFQMMQFAKYYHEQQVKSVDLADVGERKPTYNDGLRKELDRLKEKRDTALSSSAIRYWQREIDRVKKKLYG